MKRLFKPAALLFYLLATLTFFFVGVYYAGILGKAEGQGLAAGAIVIGYGVIFAVVALISALFFTFYKSDFLKRANRILFAVLVVFVLITTWRYVQRQGEVEREQAPQLNRPTTKAALMPITPGTELTKDPLGVGMFKPDFYNQRVLYFYGNPNISKAVNEHTPIDSLVFERTELGVHVSYAPPWFVPAHLKLDYDMLWMRAQSVGHEFVAVTVNETDGRVQYINRFAGELQYWPEFLLGVHAVELRDERPQPIRIKPLDHASVVHSDYAILQPVVVRGDWIQVTLLSGDYDEMATGWVRWRNEQEILLRWSLLS